MQKNFLKRPIIWGITVGQLLAIYGFYIFFEFQYWYALWFTGGDNILPEASIDYLILKPLLTLPLWWLYFVKWKRKPLAFKIFFHLVTAPVWIFVWFHLYRLIQDWRHDGYLRGDGIWWDIYIPFLVYCVQFAIFHVYDYYLQTQKQKEKEKQLMQAAYNSEVSALKAQIQPHFLFNTLNSISASVPEAMEHTRELIAQLADTFRYSLQASEKEWIPLREELEFTKTFLALEQQRLKERLEVRYEVDDSILDTPVPPMLLQPLVENAVKHGIAPLIEGGRVTVTAKKQQGKLYLAVSDTGAGVEDGLLHGIFEKGIGLRNTSLRLEKLYGQGISAQRNETGGLRFSFFIPLAP